VQEKPEMYDGKINHKNSKRNNREGNSRNKIISIEYIGAVKDQGK